MCRQMTAELGSDLAANDLLLISLAVGWTRRGDDP